MIPRLAAAIERASLDDRLTERSLRVLLLAWRHLDWVEYRSFKREFVAAWMRRRGPFEASLAGKVIVALTDSGYLEEGPRNGQMKTYRLALPVTEWATEPTEPPPSAPPSPERRGIRHGGIAA